MNVKHRTVGWIACLSLLFPLMVHAQREVRPIMKAYEAPDFIELSLRVPIKDLRMKSSELYLFSPMYIVDKDTVRFSPLALVGNNRMKAIERYRYFHEGSYPFDPVPEYIVTIDSMRRSKSENLDHRFILKSDRIDPNRVDARMFLSVMKQGCPNCAPMDTIFPVILETKR